VQAALEDRRYDVELVEVSTEGDEIRDELIHRLGKTGAFVRSLDEKVLSGELDAAVHSMKDVPTDLPEELVVAAIPERGAPGGVLVTPDGLELEELPEGAVVGTSSLRRGALLTRRRPDLEVVPLRGNVDTRIEKLLAPSLQREHERRLDAEGDDGDEEGGDEDDGTAAYDRTVETWFDDLAEVERRALERQVEAEYDAVVLAKAGLERIGLASDLAYRELSVTEFVPAPGQGALAVTAVDGEFAERLNEVLDHPRSRVEVTVERTVLATLGGGCVAPLGVHALVQGETVRTSVAVLDRAGEEAITATRHLPVERHVEAARELAEELDEDGAGRMIARARREEPDERKRS
jgi:hydroxymethylbilane synthase